MKKEIDPVSLTSDAAFKMFFKDGPKVILQSLLENFLPLSKNCSIEEVVIEDPGIPSNQREKDKEFILDMKVRLERKENESSKTEMVNVEMQTTTNPYLTDRLLAYSARIYSGRIKKGQSYKNLRRVYSLLFTTTNLAEFAIKELEKEFYHVCSIQRNRPPHLVFTKGMQFIIVELSKFHKNPDKLIDKKEAWSYLLKKSRDMDENSSALIAEKGEDMAEAVKRLWDLSEDESALEYLHAEEKRRMDREAELEYKWEKGMEKGREKEKIQIALKMIRAGFSLDDILICTELSVDRLEELKKTQVK